MPKKLVDLKKDLDTKNGVFLLNAAFMQLLEIEDTFWTNIFKTTELTFSSAFLTNKFGPKSLTLKYSGSVNLWGDDWTAALVFYKDCNFLLELKVPSSWKFSPQYFPNLTPSFDFTSGMPVPVDNFLLKLSFSNCIVSIGSLDRSKSNYIPALNFRGNLLLPNETEAFGEIKKFTGLRTAPIKGLINLQKNEIIASTDSSAQNNLPSQNQFINFEKNILSKIKLNNLGITFKSTYGNNTTPEQYFDFFSSLSVINDRSSTQLNLSVRLVPGGADIIVLQGSFEQDDNLGLKLFRSFFSDNTNATPSTFVTSYLPLNLKNALDNISLSNISLCVRPSTNAVLFAGFIVDYTDTWEIIAGKIKITSLSLEATVFNPFNSTRKIDVALNGKFTLGTSAFFNAKAIYSNGWVFYLGLAPNSTINLQDITSFFNLGGVIDISTGFTCTDLDITVDVTNNAFTGYIDLNGNWEIFKVGNNSISLIGLTLTCNIQSGSNGFSAKASFLIGTNQFMVSGAYSQLDGWIFSGYLHSAQGINLTALAADTANQLGITVNTNNFPTAILNNVQTSVKYSSQLTEFQFIGDVSIDTISIGKLQFSPIGFTIGKAVSGSVYTKFIIVLLIKDSQLVLSADNTSGDVTFLGHISIPAIKLSEILDQLFGADFTLDPSNDIALSGINLGATYVRSSTAPKFHVSFSADSLSIAFPLISRLSLTKLNFSIGYITQNNAIDRTVAISTEVSYTSAGSDPVTFGKGYIYYQNGISIYGVAINSTISIGTILNTFLGITIPANIADLLPSFAPPLGSQISIYKASLGAASSLIIEGNKYKPGFNVDKLIISVLGFSFQLNINVTGTDFTVTGYSKNIDFGFIKIVKATSDTTALDGYGPRLQIEKRVSGDTIKLGAGFVLFPGDNQVQLNADFGYTTIDANDPKKFTGRIDTNVGSTNLALGVAWSDAKGFRITDFPFAKDLCEIAGVIVKIADEIKRFLNAIPSDNCTRVCGAIANFVLPNNVGLKFEKINVSPSPVATAGKVTISVSGSFSLYVGSIKAGDISMNNIIIGIDIPKDLTGMITSILNALVDGNNLNSVVGNFFTMQNAKTFSTFLIILGSEKVGKALACRALCLLGDALKDAIASALADALAKGGAALATALGVLEVFTESFSQDDMQKITNKVDINKLLIVSNITTVIDSSTNKLKVAWEHTNPKFKDGIISFDITFNEQTYTTNSSPYEINLGANQLSGAEKRLTIQEKYAVNNQTYTSDKSNVDVKFPVAPIDLIAGQYECHLYDKGGKNNWHYVTISKINDTTYRWTNRAGVSWTLTTTSDNTILNVGADCPYYDFKQGTASTKYRQAKIVMAGGQITGILGPWGELYTKSHLS